MTVNYLLSTWAGEKRRNPSTEYLQAHLDKLFSLQNNLSQVTVIRPLGSNNKEFYKLKPSVKKKITLIDRPANDRSYGQFFYAFNQFPYFDYYILAEDDYLPMVDGFDSILIEMLNEKGVDYLCGKYHNHRAEDPKHPEQNIGIVKGEALRKILQANPDPYFPVNGLDDGSEKIIFAKLFTDLGLTIDDYSDRFAVPYWDRYLRYLTPFKDNPLFSPYQLEIGKAFTYDWDTKETPADLESHFLMDIDIRPGNVIAIDGQDVGRYFKTDAGFDVHVKKYGKQIADRLKYINRSEKVIVNLL